MPFGDYEGAPTLLLPDPDKDPKLEPSVRALWEEFELALEASSHVLVVGHSLHDPVLVARLRASASKVAVTTYPQQRGAVAVPKDEETWIRSLLPDAQLMAMQLGPDLWVHQPAFQNWARS